MNEVFIFCVLSKSLRYSVSVVASVILSVFRVSLGGRSIGELLGTIGVVPRESCERFGFQA